PYTHNNLGLAYARLEQHDKAIEQFRLAVAMDPTYHKAYNNLAVSLGALGKDEEAAEAYRHALEAQGGYAVAAAGLAYTEWKKSQEAPAGPPRVNPAASVASSVLLDRLTSRDWQDREDAIAVLTERAERDLLPALLELLSDERTDVRAAAVRVL